MAAKTGFFRGLAYKVVRGILSSAVAVGMVAVTASPLGWIAVPIIGAVGKAIRIKLVNSGRKDLEKWVVI